MPCMFACIFSMSDDPSWLAVVVEVTVESAVVVDAGDTVVVASPVDHKTKYTQHISTGRRCDSTKHSVVASMCQHVPLKTRESNSLSHCPLARENPVMQAWHVSSFDAEHVTVKQLEMGVHAELCVTQTGVAGVHAIVHAWAHGN